MDKKKPTLEKLYYNPQIGFTSINKFFDKVKQYGYKRNEVNKFIKSQATNQVHINKKRVTAFNSITSPAIDNNWQIDLLDIWKFKTTNKNITFILT